jgi:hypothetical protein
VTDNVVKFPGLFYGELTAPTMLRKIADLEPNHAFVISWPADGAMPSYHSSTGDIPIVMLRIQEFVHKYYNGDFHGK